MIFRFININLFLFLFILLRFASAQGKYDISLAEDSLKLLSDKIQNAENDSIRYILNYRFEQTFYRSLLNQGSFDYPFDSLKTIAKITSPDKKFRIYNWNLPKGDGTNIYFGFIQLTPKVNKDHFVFRLSDCSDSIPEPESASLDYRSWFGCLYYKIILTSFNNQKYYTLLAWDGINPQLSQKMIEVLWFDSVNQPHFGARIFKKSGNDQSCRIFFKYSSTSSMLLTYDDQYITQNKKWNPAKRKFESKTEKISMIVCDELIPLDPQLEGQFEFYVPSSEVFDGFIFNEGCWYFHKDIDVRNERQ